MAVRMTVPGPRAWGRLAGPCLARVGARGGRSVPRVRHGLRPRRPLRV